MPGTVTKRVFGPPESLTLRPFHYCPGCGYGVIHRLIGEVIDELGIKEKTVGIASVGCSVLIYDYFDVDFLEAAHGRAPACASAMKRLNPELLVFSYQGDGDLASIGIAELLHAANRGENITVIFTNNAVYGMTGGQMAPTTLPGMVTTTTPQGRDPSVHGYPLKVSELIKDLPGVAYVERTAICSPKTIISTKRAIKKAFEYQLERKGFTLVEILSPCPTNWKMTPAEAWEYVEKKMTEIFPLGVFKDVG